MNNLIRCLAHWFKGREEGVLIKRLNTSHQKSLARPANRVGPPIWCGGGVTAALCVSNVVFKHRPETFASTVRGSSFYESIQWMQSFILVAPHLVAQHKKSGTTIGLLNRVQVPPGQVAEPAT